jgi:hypothetical protein
MKSGEAKNNLVCFIFVFDPRSVITILMLRCEDLIQSGTKVT